MRLEIAKLWIKALRSGKYKQGYRTLRCSGGRFCALGVLCDLYIKSGSSLNSVGWKKLAGQGHEENAGPFTPFTVLDSEYQLPLEVRMWSGVSSRSGFLPGKGSIVSMNDVKRATFYEISNFIEDNWDLL